MITDVEIEFSTAAVPVALNRNAVIDAERPNRQIKSKSDTHIGGDMVSTEIVSVGMNKTGVVKNRAARFRYNRKCIFNRRACQ